MHYSLAQCKALAQALLHPENLDLSEHVQINLDHEMPWPSDHAVKEVMLLEAKSKKKAALRLGITRRCLRRRLKEIKEFGYSTGRVSPVSVVEILNRLLRDQTLQDIAIETEVSQAWICRMLCNLFVARQMRYDRADIRPRTPRAVGVNNSVTSPTELTFETTAGSIQRIRYTITSTPWFQADVSSTNATGYQWINMSTNSFTNMSDYVNSEYGDEEVQNERSEQTSQGGITGAA